MLQLVCRWALKIPKADWARDRSPQHSSIMALGRRGFQFIPTSIRSATDNQAAQLHTYRRWKEQIKWWPVIELHLQHLRNYGTKPLVQRCMQCEWGCSFSNEGRKPQRCGCSPMTTVNHREEMSRTTYLLKSIPTWALLHWQSLEIELPMPDTRTIRLSSSIM